MRCLKVHRKWASWNKTALYTDFKGFFGTKINIYIYFTLSPKNFLKYPHAILGSSRYLHSRDRGRGVFHFQAFNFLMHSGEVLKLLVLGYCQYPHTIGQLFSHSAVSRNHLGVPEKPRLMVLHQIFYFNDFWIGFENSTAQEFCAPDTVQGIMMCK